MRNPPYQQIFWRPGGVRKHQTVSESRVSEWDQEFDVIVVGSGAGGLTAALFAQEGGLSTLVIEKSDRYGGTSAVSGGGIWIPCNDQMEALGCSDSFDEARQYLDGLIGGEVEGSRLDAYIHHGKEMVSALARRFGVHFNAVPIYPDYFPHKPGGKPGFRTMEPADFDASLLGDDFDTQREPFPGTQLMGRIAMNQVEAHMLLCRDPGWIRGFMRLVWNYFTDLSWRRKTRRDRRLVLGQALVGSLRHALARAGQPLWLNTALKELVAHEGRVVGLVVEREGRLLRLRARRGVIMASGGFEANQAMRERYLPKPTDTRWSVAPPINHGEGIEAGQKLGAATRFMHLTWGTPSVVVPGVSSASGLFIERACPHGIMVNGQGRRFCNEAGPYTEVVYSLYEDHDKTGCTIPAWLIVDARFRHKYPLGPIMPAMMQPDSKIPADWEGRVYFKAQSLSELAGRIGVDAQGLLDSVQRYNAQCQSGKDEDFGKGENVFDRYYGDVSAKPNPCMGSLDKAPFYAVPVSPGELGTKGGLDTDAAGRVLREDGSVIEGFYAVGNCSAAVMGRTYAGPGSTLGPAMTFAYLAARDLIGAETATREAASA